MLVWHWKEDPNALLMFNAKMHIPKTLVLSHTGLNAVIGQSLAWLGMSTISNSHYFVILIFLYIISPNQKPWKLDVMQRVRKVVIMCRSKEKSICKAGALDSFSWSGSGILIHAVDSYKDKFFLHKDPADHISISSHQDLDILTPDEMF